MPPRPDTNPQHVPGLSSDTTRPRDAVPPLRPPVEIPVLSTEPDLAAQEKHRSHGRFLARQDAWDQLAEEIEAADSQGARTVGLTPVAKLLAEGARSDVIEATRDAIGRREQNAVRTMLTAFETIVEDAPDSPALPSVVALAHIEAAAGWRGAAQVQDLKRVRRKSFRHHMAAARAMAERFDPVECAWPLGAYVRCAMIDGIETPTASAPGLYEDLIDLDPLSPCHMRAMGRDIRPGRFGTWEALEAAARRAAFLTEDVWGGGGYAWVYIGALELDEGALRRIDPDFFTEGLHDILERVPAQDMVNRLAAFTGLTMGGSAERGSPRRKIGDAFGWIVQDHLRELHPSIWARAPVAGTPSATPGTPEDIARRGRARAMTSLAAYYAPALQSGRRLVFDGDGMRLVTGR